MTESLPRPADVGLLGLNLDDDGRTSRFELIPGRHQGRVPEDTTWVLLELRGHLAYGAHAHGSVRVWSPAGDLLAVGGQSANMMHTFDPSQVPGPMAALLGGGAPGATR